MCNIIIESGHNTSYISSTLISLFYNNTYLEDLFLNKHTCDVRCMYLQEIIKNEFVNKIRERQSIFGDTINKIRIVSHFIGWAEKDVLFSEHNAIDYLNFLIKSFDTQFSLDSTYYIEINPSGNTSVNKELLKKLKHKCDCDKCRESNNFYPCPPNTDINGDKTNALSLEHKHNGAKQELLLPENDIPTQKNITSTLTVVLSDNPRQMSTLPSPCFNKTLYASAIPRSKPQGALKLYEISSADEQISMLSNDSCTSYKQSNSIINIENCCHNNIFNQKLFPVLCISINRNGCNMLVEIEKYIKLSFVFDKKSNLEQYYNEYTSKRNLSQNMVESNELIDNKIDVKFIFHSAICFNNKSYYSLINCNKKWYIFCDAYFPAFVLVDMGNKKIIDKIKTEAVIIIYKMNVY